jgi:hypothetical protein
MNTGDVGVDITSEGVQEAHTAHHMCERAASMGPCRCADRRAAATPTTLWRFREAGLHKVLIERKGNADA